MTIEILYPEFCMMYGDRANIALVEKTFKDATIIKTHFKEIPNFVSSKPELIYIGSMAETNIDLVLEELSNYKKELKSFVEDGGHLLVTGNASDIFGKKINDRVALEIFDYDVERNFNKRHNCIFLGKYEDIKIVGNKTQFSLHNVSTNSQFIEVIGGFGSNLQNNFEGIHHKNSFVTSLHGPFLILNPLFTKKLFKELGFEDDLPFEKELMDAYNFRLARMLEEGAIFVQDDHGR